MTDQTRSAIIRAPVTMKIGPIPADLTSHSQITTFALAHFQRVILGANKTAVVDGSQAIVSYLAPEILTSFSIGGKPLDDRHYRVQPEGDLHKLEISTDKGATFAFAANFADYDFARVIGDAWVEGRTEKSE